MQQKLTAGQATGPAVFTMSSVFPGRTICEFCGLPFPPDNFAKPGVCSMCAEKVLKAKNALIVSKMSDGVPGRKSAFEEALSALRNEAGPATTRVTEALLGKLGGAEELGDMIAGDIRRARGDDLTPEMKEMFEPDLKSLTRLYDIVLRMVAKRDDLVQGVSDPLEGMDPDDLMPLVAESAFLMIEMDHDFRMRVLRKIHEQAPEDIDQLWAEQAGLLPVPGVEVV